MMMINRFRKSNYVLLLLTKVLTKHMLITGQSHSIISNVKFDYESKINPFLFKLTYE